MTPPPSPPPVPPGASYVTRVTSQLTLAGDVSTFDAASFRAAYLAHLRSVTGTVTGYSVSVQADVDGTDLSAVEVEYERDLEDGRTLTASLTPADKNLEVEVTDTKFESGATWTAKASVPLEGDNLIDDAKLTLTRAWSW